MRPGAWTGGGDEFLLGKLALQIAVAAPSQSSTRTLHLLVIDSSHNCDILLGLRACRRLLSICAKPRHSKYLLFSTLGYRRLAYMHTFQGYRPQHEDRVRPEAPDAPFDPSHGSAPRHHDALANPGAAPQDQRSRVIYLKLPLRQKPNLAAAASGSSGSGYPTTPVGSWLSIKFHFFSRSI